MMNKKGEFTARNYILGVIVLSSVIALSYLMIQALAYNYDNEAILDDNYQRNFNKLSNMTKLAEDVYNVSASSEGLSFLDTAELLLGSTTSVISLITGSIGVFGNQVLNMGEYLGIDKRVTSIIFLVFIMIITMLIIFSILNFINRTKEL
jgi:hypothetical protein